MQKHNYSFVLVLMVMAFSLVFAGCKKDDEAATARKALLTTGVWKGVDYRIRTTASGQSVTDKTESTANTTREFKSNGTVIIGVTDEKGATTTSTGVWTLSNENKRLTVIASANSSTYDIKEISSNSLILFNTLSYVVAGVTTTAEQTSTYTK